jgi:hypothetical protein
MYAMSPEARRLRSAQARAAGLQGAAMRDNQALGRVGQRGLTARFYAKVDGQFPNASPADREHRMRMLRRAHMIRVRGERTRKEVRRATPRSAV